MAGIIIEPHKMVYWPIPKNACTTVKVRIAAILGIPHRLGQNIHEAPFPTTNVVLDGYLNFAFVRHPLRRLYSAYSNKIVPDGRTDQFYDEGIERVVLGKFKDRLRCSMTLAEFCEVLFDTPELQGDPHFAPQHPQVPNNIKIYKLEIISPLLRMLLPVYNSNFYRVKWEDVYDPLTFVRAAKFYAGDFRRFDYTGGSPKLGAAYATIIDRRSR